MISVFNRVKIIVEKEVNADLPAFFPIFTMLSKDLLCY